MNLPSNERAEKSMLGILAHTPDIMDSVPVSSDHFLHFAHRIVFDAIAAIYRAGGKVSYHTVVSRLGAAVVARLGGDAALIDIIRFVPASALPLIYEDLDAALLQRRLLALSEWMAVSANNPSELATVLPELNRRVAGLETASDAENILRPVVEAIQSKLRRMDEGTNEGGFKTSISVWNDAFGGIMDGGFYALAGRPGRGKSAMMEQLIADYMAEEIPVVVFEKDMSPQKLVERMACRETRIPFWRYHQRRTTREENATIRAMVDEFARANVMRLYSPVGLTADRLCAIARREIKQGGAKCVFVDHIQALNVGRDLREGFTAASLTLRRHVTETQVPLIALAHLNRDAGENRPSASNIKEFDQLYGDVDGMALLWHEPSQAEESIKQVKFFVAKNRDGGETEETVIFDGPLMQFKGKAAL